MPRSQRSVKKNKSAAGGDDASGASAKKWLDQLTKRFESKEQYLIPMLQYVQGEVGFLPPEAMRAVARYLRVPESKVYGVASFYAQFHFEPRGINTVTVCRGTACHVRGSGRLVQDLMKKFAIEPGGTTEDGIFTLETVACFGACALAPVVVVNKRVHGRQTSASVKRLVEREASGSRPKATRGSSRTKRSSRMARKKK